jgi:hypothetical protein
MLLGGFYQLSLSGDRGQLARLPLKPLKRMTFLSSIISDGHAMTFLKLRVCDIARGQ